MNEHDKAIKQMENKILGTLSELDWGYGITKEPLSERTGIPIDILTVLLKRLRKSGDVKLIMFISEYTGLCAGSGYCLTNNKSK